MSNDLEILNGEKESHQQRTSNKNNIWLIIIAILLFLSLSLNTYQLIQQQAESDITLERSAAIESAEKLLHTHRTIVSRLESDYSESVYNNPRVDNINKQLLMSQEYTFITLQLISEQNLQIIELLSTME